MRFRLRTEAYNVFNLYSDIIKKKFVSFLYTFLYIFLNVIKKAFPLKISCLLKVYPFLFLLLWKLFHASCGLIILLCFGISESSYAYPCRKLYSLALFIIRRAVYGGFIYNLASNVFPLYSLFGSQSSTRFKTFICGFW